MLTRLERKKALIKELATMLATRQVEFSLRLAAKGSDENGPRDPDVAHWARLRELCRMNGYPNKEEAVELLEEFLL